MRVRSPQLSLRLDAEPPAAESRWRDGAELSFLGETLLLQLDTELQTVAIGEGRLHLPLPPGATPRQIQDGAEACLRREAAAVIDALLARLRRPPPSWSFSFAARGSWTQLRPDGSLRLNWRLIEQSPAVIEQALQQTLKAVPGEQAPLLPDLLLA